MWTNPAAGSTHIAVAVAPIVVVAVVLPIAAAFAVALVRVAVAESVVVGGSAAADDTVLVADCESCSAVLAAHEVETEQSKQTVQSNCTAVVVVAAAAVVAAAVVDRGPVLTTQLQSFSGSRDCWVVGDFEARMSPNLPFFGLVSQVLLPGEECPFVGEKMLIWRPFGGPFLPVAVEAGPVALEMEWRRLPFGGRRVVRQ
mmetsp:Transcript_19001/g.52050  ORF Transcript_19001/g.52050 Transcript_19001/m.52050 type:complete len:200 (-) Transcript_19001:426-1025(-)